MNMGISQSFVRLVESTVFNGGWRREKEKGEGRGKGRRVKIVFLNTKERNMGK